MTFENNYVKLKNYVFTSDSFSRKKKWFGPSTGGVFYSTIVFSCNSIQFSV